MSNVPEQKPLTTTSGQVRTPKPPLEVWVHLLGTWPQFRLQDISGIGPPIAVQFMTKILPTPQGNFTSGGGGTITLGFAESRRNSLKEYRYRGGANGK